MTLNQTAEKETYEICHTGHNVIYRISYIVNDEIKDWHRYYFMKQKIKYGKSSFNVDNYLPSGRTVDLPKVKKKKK